MHSTEQVLYSLKLGVSFNVLLSVQFRRINTKRFWNLRHVHVAKFNGPHTDCGLFVRSFARTNLVCLPKPKRHLTF